ncbi:2'-5' RNA ligase family protein [candidate division KSB1 bacterium]|nr:2'-5' RNA ligase family protein [candidate division KSB1 bacterium]
MLQTSGQQKSNTAAVVLIPPQTLWPTIQAIRSQYDRHVNRWMPHITMLYPFRPHSLFNNIAPELSESCKHIQPFELRLSYVRYSQHDGDRFIMWLAPEPHAPLIQLQETIQQVAPDCNDVTQFENGWQPHLTVGQIDGVDNFRNVWRTIQANWIPIEFTVRSVALIYRNNHPDDVFRVWREFPLGE